MFLQEIRKIWFILLYKSNVNFLQGFGILFLIQFGRWLQCHYMWSILLFYVILSLIIYVNKWVIVGMDGRGRMGIAASLVHEDSLKSCALPIRLPRSYNSYLFLKQGSLPWCPIVSIFLFKFNQLNPFIKFQQNRLLSGRIMITLYLFTVTNICHSTTLQRFLPKPFAYQFTCVCLLQNQDVRVVEKVLISSLICIKLHTKPCLVNQLMSDIISS